MDFSKMLEQMRAAQGKFKEVQKNIDKIQVTEEVGAGLVKVCIDGNKKILKLEIDDTLIDVDSKKMLEDLIIAAINLATASVEKQVQGKLQASTIGVMKDIPLDFMK